MSIKSRNAMHTCGRERHGVGTIRYDQHINLFTRTQDPVVRRW